MKKLTVLFVLPLLAFTLAPAEAESADNPQQQRGWLGVYTENLSEAMLVALDIDHGVLIADVADESPAAAVGFEKGDVVVELDGRQIEGASDLRYVVRDRPGRKVVVQIRRRGRPARIDVTLDARDTDAAWLESDKWLRIPEDAMRVAVKALREVGEPGVKKEVKLRVKKFDGELLELDKLREELEELKAELAEELEELREEFRERIKDRTSE
jgi:C-terminal processing protease CtpA/Prc